MLSIPTANPTSIWPHRTLLAMSVTAMRPDEHHRLMTCTAVVSGIPAAMAAARASYAPLGVSTVPTVISPIRAGSIADRAMDCYEVTVSFEA